jgi:AGZA family xanthine/uracil permease-like MFS transporter
MIRRVVPAIGDRLERRFGLRDHGTSVRTELSAGMTTFLTMGYILVVNPAILAAAGVPLSGALLATCLGAAAGSLFMGLLANYPFALAPGMGINAYFTYTVVQGQGYPWTVALGAVFLSGLLFLLLTVARLRGLLVEAIPMAIKGALAAGIGLFIAFVGLKNAGLVVASPTTLVTFGGLRRPECLLALGGLILTAALVARQVRAAFLLGILAVAAAGMLLGLAPVPEAIVAWPDWRSTLFQLDIRGALQVGLVEIVVVFLFVDLFDTLGSLMGLSRQAGFLTPTGRLPRLHRALMSDALATSVGALCGTSTVVTYIESATGISEGGRTGLTACVTGSLFLMAIFFAPLVGAIPVVATAPALILVGALMVGTLRTLPWDDLTEALPAFLTFLAMPLTFSIANGLALGMISYPLVKLLAGRARDLSWGTVLVATLFLLRFLYLAVEG